MADKETEIGEVLERLGRGSHGPDSIALLAARLIELRNQNTRTEFASEFEIKIFSPSGESSSIFLHNLWRECERSPEKRAEIVDRYVRILSPPSDRVEVSAKDVVIVVRDAEYRNFVQVDERDLITDHLLGDLWMILAVDLPESIEILTAKQAALLGFGKKELIKLGVENVEGMLGQMQFSPRGECLTLGCENIEYASTALLLDYVWDQAANLVEGHLVVAVPARDTVLFTGSANTKGLEQIREEANYVVTNGNHLVTDTLLKRVGSEWKLFS